jgi:hypothetical protein
MRYLAINASLRFVTADIPDVSSPSALSLCPPVGRRKRNVYPRSFRRPGRSSLMAVLVGQQRRQILRAYLSPPIRNEALQALLTFHAQQKDLYRAHPLIAPHFTTARQSRTLYARVPAIPRIAEVLSSPPFTSLESRRIYFCRVVPRARAPPRKSKHCGRGEPPPYIKRLIRRRVVREYRRKFDETPAHAFPARRPT